MEIWFDIYDNPHSPDSLRWRVILDTIRNLFTVKPVPFQPTTVAEDSEGRYFFSDIPARLAVGGNLIMSVADPVSLTVISGGGYNKHVLSANGNQVAVKDFNASWPHQTYIVPPPNPLALLDLLTGTQAVDTRVWQ